MYRLYLEILFYLERTYITRFRCVLMTFSYNLSILYLYNIRILHISFEKLLGPRTLLKLLK